MPKNLFSDSKKSMTPLDIINWFLENKISRDQYLNNTAGLPIRYNFNDLRTKLCLIPLVKQKVDELLSSLNDLDEIDKHKPIYLLGNLDKDKHYEINEVILRSWVHSEEIECDYVQIKPSIDSVLINNELVFSVPRTYFRNLSEYGRIKYLGLLFRVIAFNHYTSNANNIAVVSSYKLYKFKADQH